MKILYLKLVNFIGIYAGMNEREIIIDFTKDINGNDIKSNNIVMLFGGNGSGKTTILSTLHPYMDTLNDCRSDIILKDREGYKEIHYKIKDKYYVIKHYYKKQNKSYIKEMDYDEYIKYKSSFDINIGIELNEAGGIRNFKALIEDIFGVTEETFKLSRLGSNVTNFIELSTSKRKEHISLYLPDIEEYLEAFKKVNDNFSIVKKEIAYIADEINKLDTKENLDMKKTSIENGINLLNESIKTNISSIAEYKGKISILDPNNEYINNFDKIKDDYEDKKKDFIRLVNELKIEKDNIKDYIHLVDNIDNDIKIVSDMITENKFNLDKNKNLLSEYSNILNKNNIMIKDITDKQEELSIYEDIKKELYDISKEMKLKENDLLNYDHIDINECYSIYNKTKEIKDYTLDVVMEITNMDNKNIDFINYEGEIILSKLKKDIEDTSNLLEETKNKISFYTEKLKLLDILKSRPSNCKIDDCPFIKESLKYKDIDSILIEEENNLNIYTCNIEKFRKEYSLQLSIYELYKRIKNIYDQIVLVKNKSNVYKDISSFNKYIEIIMNKTSLDINKIFDYSSIVEYKNILNEYNVKKIKFDNISELKKNYSSNDILNKLKKDNNELDKKIKSLNTIIFDINENIVSNNNKLEELNVIKTNIDNYNKKLSIYKESKNSILELENSFNNIKNSIDKIKEYEIIINENIELENKNKEILDKLNKEYNDIDYKIKRLDEYNERKSILDNKYNDLEMIKNSLDPKKGIPVYFIDNYLVKTKDITNELLNISQKGKFNIDIEVDSKDFFIKVYKDNGDILNDILIASQGEVAITSLSLSLALLEQSMTNHNILYLDELDGALDDSNRRSFIDMVTLQMKKLDIEQVFIISHNKEFEYQSLDLILLRDNNFDINDEIIMNNKNIIFKK